MAHLIAIVEFNDFFLFATRLNTKILLSPLKVILLDGNSKIKAKNDLLRHAVMTNSKNCVQSIIYAY